jgi:hypothetical protein
MSDKLKVGTRSNYPCLTGLVIDKGYGDYTFKLRMQGGNPFHDPTLDPFVGKRVMVEGERHDYTFIVRCIEEL